MNSIYFFQLMLRFFVLAHTAYIFLTRTLSIFMIICFKISGLIILTFHHVWLGWCSLFKLSLPVLIPCDFSFSFP